MGEKVKETVVRDMPAPGTWTPQGGVGPMPGEETDAGRMPGEEMTGPGIDLMPGEETGGEETGVPGLMPGEETLSEQELAEAVVEELRTFELTGTWKMSFFLAPRQEP